MENKMTTGVCEIVEGYRKVDHPLWYTYNNMKSRCTNPNNPDYHRYGGRGIHICSRWLGSFSTFVADMGTKPCDGSTIDRENNDKGYNPENCRWTDPSTQCHNRSEFANNKSGCTGVKMVRSKTCPGWSAVFDDRHVRFNLGNYTDKMDAINARVTFASMYHANKAAALEWLRDNRPNLRRNNTTGVTGVTRMTGENSNFIVRHWCTNSKSRTVIGYRDTIAKSAKLYNDYIDAVNNGTKEQFLNIEKSKPRHKRVTK